ncbi:hypothetical protein Syun_011584 [Stephania yunnanensis]|uniref:Uncharacterized protein n=1 Tax=Stephania yunnanensis TaxID=152371 RepID=A0AAP0JYJ1_9MAGN
MPVECYCRSSNERMVMARGFHIGRHGFSCFPIAETVKAETTTSTRSCKGKDHEYEEKSSCTCSSSSSSIGRDSDFKEINKDDDDDDEIQSPFRSQPLDSMDALEESLPIRRGISEFYGGKSKSFTSLQDASNCCSAKEIAKPDNAYTRKRKNMMNYMLRIGDDKENNNNDYSQRVSKRSKRTQQSCASIVSEKELLLLNEPIQPC